MSFIPAHLQPLLFLRKWTSYLFAGPEQHQFGIHVKRMPKLGFINANDPEAFGFLDPSNVIHGCHIKPAFVFGTTNQFLVGSLIARQEQDGDIDYFCYYVNMYVCCTFLSFSL